jgi:hypothetical protein
MDHFLGFMKGKMFKGAVDGAWTCKSIYIHVCQVLARQPGVRGGKEV